MPAFATAASFPVREAPMGPDNLFSPFQEAEPEVEGHGDVEGTDEYVDGQMAQVLACPGRAAEAGDKGGGGTRAGQAAGGSANVRPRVLRRRQDPDREGSRPTSTQAWQSQGSIHRGIRLSVTVARIDGPSSRRRQPPPVCVTASSGHRAIPWGRPLGERAPRPSSPRRSVWLAQSRDL